MFVNDVQHSKQDEFMLHHPISNNNNASALQYFEKALNLFVSESCDGSHWHLTKSHGNIANHFSAFRTINMILLSTLHSGFSMLA